MKTMPTRIDGELFEAARAAGEVQSRSAAQQLDHWARIGREFETSPSVTHSAIAAVLTGVAPYDELRDSEQAVVRVAWDERITAGIAELDFTDALLEAGRPWAESDPAGNVVMVNERAAPRTNAKVSRTELDESLDSSSGA